MKKFIILAIAVLPAFAANDLADLLNTDADVTTNSIVTIKSTNVEEPTSLLTITGQLNSISSYSMVREWVMRGGVNAYNNNRISTYMNAELFVDIRLRESIKGFADVSIRYNPMGDIVAHNVSQITNVITLGATNYTYYDTNYITLVVKELFFDANIAKAVYFRTGKQVLAWGQGYLWNPSDLINIQKKDFANITTANLTREGTYGIKMHIPFGTVANIYGFVDMRDVQNFRDIGAAGKFEAVLFGWEASISAVARQNYIPVYAADLTGRIPLINVDIRAEATLSYGFNKPHLIGITTNVIMFYTNYSAVTDKWDNTWVTRVCLGFSKSFTMFDVTDRLTVIGEYLYNGAGYNEAIFRDTVKKRFFDPVFNPYGLYEMNYTGMHYAFLSASYLKFILADMTLNFNAIANCSDWSGVLSLGLNYNPVYNFTLGLTVSGYVGEENGEFTMGNAYSASAPGMSVTFNAQLNF